MGIRSIGSSFRIPWKGMPRVNSILAIPSTTWCISSTRLIPYGWGAIPGSPEAQEWWARYDRQRLARDIYVLLYTVGCPDSLNPTTTPYATGDTNMNGIDDMVEAMAQFAVNFVDQLDRDSVITKFEYDDDLSDGWSTAGADKVAYGVEHQQLVFSEVMYIQSDIDSTDHATTLHDDTSDTHRWLHIELRNASPFPVDMKEETWRIARMTPGTNTLEAAVDFGNGPTYRTVAAGNNILISMHDGTVSNGMGESICSDFYADVSGGPSWNHCCPTTARLSSTTIRIPIRRPTSTCAIPPA